jgi:hypothetical protein
MNTADVRKAVGIGMIAVVLIVIGSVAVAAAGPVVTLFSILSN